jgi:hypothetical protein
MTTYVTINVDGTIDTNPVATAEFQKIMLNEGTVVTLASPVTREHWTSGEPLIGWVYDWGAVHGGPDGGPMPVNLKAWALYGRSTIHGPMMIASDARVPLTDEFLAMIDSPIEDWVPGDTLVRMAEILGE